MSTTDRYRRIRRQDPYLPARHALSIARDAEAAQLAGATFYAPWTIEHEGETFTVEVEPEDWDFAWDGDCYGEVIDRYPHPDYVGMPQYDRADGETVLALDESHAYEVDSAAESVTALAKSYQRFYGASRAVCRDLARTELRKMGDRMLYAMNGGDRGEYVITVRSADGQDWDTLGAVDVNHDDAGIGYLYSCAVEMADEVVYNRAARIEAERAAIEERAAEALSASLLAEVGA